MGIIRLNTDSYVWVSVLCWKIKLSRMLYISTLSIWLSWTFNTKRHPKWVIFDIAINGYCSYCTLCLLNPTVYLSLCTVTSLHKPRKYNDHTRRKHTPPLSLPPAGFISLYNIGKEIALQHDLHLTKSKTHIPIRTFIFVMSLIWIIFTVTTPYLR